MAFLNLDKGYGYGFVSIECKAAKTVNPKLGISDGADNGKYWSRTLVGQTPTTLGEGDRFEERTAYVLFRCSQAKPLGDFLDWRQKILRASAAAERPAPR